MMPKLKKINMPKRLGKTILIAVKVVDITREKCSFAVSSYLNAI